MNASALKLALALARRGCGHTRPNPPVGAVIVRAGEVIGEDAPQSKPDDGPKA